MKFICTLFAVYQPDLAAAAEHLGSDAASILENWCVATAPWPPPSIYIYICLAFQAHTLHKRAQMYNLSAARRLNENTITRQCTTIRNHGYSHITAVTPFSKACHHLPDPDLLNHAPITEKSICQMPPCQPPLSPPQALLDALCMVL